MNPVLRATLLIAVVLLVPVLPLIALGLSFEEDVSEWLNAERSPALHFVLIVALLASDLFLPVPSSAVSTYAGGSGIGLWPALLASWIGMTAGAVLGFGLARACGATFARRLAGHRDLDKTAALVQRFGPHSLLVTRALPILAEACVLLTGAMRLSWKRFLPPVLAANLVISLVYAAFGSYFADTDAFWYAVVASGTVPLLVALAARRWLPGMASADESEPANDQPHES